MKKERSPHASRRATVLASLVAAVQYSSSGVVAQSTACLNGHIYELYTTVGLNWGQANKYASGLTNCGKQGHLVTITSATEQLYVQDLLASAEYGGKVWLGLSSKQTNAPFKWVTGEALGFSNWDTLHSSKSVGNTCAVMDATSDGMWHDEWCKAPKGSLAANYNFPFVVEYDCDTTVCSTVPASFVAQDTTGSTCKAKKERCWVDADCCQGLVCQGGSFKYCKKA